MIEEEHDEQLDGVPEDEYVPEWRALASMLKEPHQDELKRRMGE